MKIEEHIYRSESFVELIEDAVEFMINTPFEKLPPEVKFAGGGVYALYYKGNIPQYKKIYSKTHIDGFGNHDPGKGRYEQARSEWDVLHPGRVWADRLKGTPPDENKVEEKIGIYHVNKST